MVISGKVEAPLEPKSFGVHPNKLQFVLLPIIRFESVNYLPPIHYSTIMPKVGVIDPLVANVLLIYPFFSKEPTYT